jgi:hypothetical protein
MNGDLPLFGATAYMSPAVRQAVEADKDLMMYFSPTRIWSTQLIERFAAQVIAPQVQTKYDIF